MCQLVEDFAKEYAKEYGIEVKQKDIISFVLGAKDKLSVMDLAECLNISIDKVQQIINFNSNDIEYIYNQLK